jgi:exopolysaccharide production protein ExoY
MGKTELKVMTDLNIVKQNRKSNRRKSFLIVKRCIDIFGGVLGLILTLPVFCIVALSYLLEEKKGPVFFKQIRVGHNGKRFYIYKFRSMIVDAEEWLQKDKKIFREYVKNNYKLEPKKDPRITKMGRFLRKTSLDELPQLLNVIKGDMSLVGPRPVVEAELVEYGEQTELFLSCKPGITGYWQVSGRSSVNYPERVNLEIYYVENQSLLFDFTILCKTVIGVISRRGAY